MTGRGRPIWQLDRLSLLAQRDLLNWSVPAKVRTMDRLLHMLATVHGLEWNAIQGGQELGANKTRAGF